MNEKGDITTDSSDIERTWGNIMKKQYANKFDKWHEIAYAWKQTEFIVKNLTKKTPDPDGCTEKFYQTFEKINNTNST